MNNSYRHRFLTFFLFLSVLAIGLNTSEVFGQSKRGSATRAAVAGPADVLLTENFEYTAGTSLTANGWSAHSSGGTNPINVTAPGLTYAGYTGSGIGNAVSMSATGEDVSKSLSATISSGSVYAAFLVNVTTSTTTGDYFFHLQNGASNFGGRVWVRKDSVENTFAFGVSRSSTSSGGAPVFSPAIYQPGTTYLVVVKYTFVDGTTNDVASIFINPTPGAAEPAPTVTANDVSGADLANFTLVGLRQGGTSSGPTQRVDGIRVATTWADAAAGTGSPATPQPANVDMNGDGFTDFVLVRESVPGAGLSDRLAGTSRPVGRRQRAEAARSSESLAGGANQIEWWIDYNNAPGGVSGVWGLYGVDTIVSADFDGDGADDVAIWRPVIDGEGGFYSINSSDLTFRYSAFGLENDNPTVVGDYDGDGFDDPATFRCPDVDPGECYFFYRGSLNNPTDGITYIQWGFGTSFDYFPNHGDFDGDGKYDFCLMDVKNPQAVFWLWLNGTETREATQWGLDSDFVVPGDYDGDGKSDYAVMRYEGDDIVFYILERDGGMRAVKWGIFGDVPAPGDYDGDGKQDIAVHRWNDTDTTFWILPSNGDPYWTFNYGARGDEPVAAWYVQ